MGFWDRLIKGKQMITCLACGKEISDLKDATKFECNVCGLKGHFHHTCLHGNQPQSGGAIILSTGLMCPQCAKNASIPVPDISEQIIDQIITLVNQFDVADKRGDSRKIEQVKGVLYQIGTRLDEQGGMELMQKAYKRSILKGKLGPKANLLNYSWDGVGQWSW